LGKYLWNILFRITDSSLDQVQRFAWQSQIALAKHQSKQEKLQQFTMKEVIIGLTPVGKYALDH
jgi:hypothetical protein